MKKSYLMIAAAAMTMVACTNDNIFTDIQEENNQTTAISFQSFKEKLTRSNFESSKPASADYYLESYHLTMKVYGTKKDADNAVQRVFNGVTCTFDASGDALTGEWSYSPARFWDKQSDYCFAAYAPAAAPIKYTASSDAEITATGGKFESTGVFTLIAQNLDQQNGVASGEYNIGFDGASGHDTDIMISDYTTKQGAAGGTVDLIFKHTLSKLVIALKAGDDAPASGKAGYIVKVKKIVVENYLSEGEFDTDTWTADASSDCIDYVFNAASSDAVSGDAVELSTSLQYFIESLVFPQDMKDDQEITIEYTITSKDSIGNEYTEDFKYKKKVPEIFPNNDPYEEGNKYKIDFTIDPDQNVIKFDAGVYEWAEKSKETNI